MALARYTLLLIAGIPAVLAFNLAAWNKPAFLRDMRLTSSNTWEKSVNPSSIYKVRTKQGMVAGVTDDWCGENMLRTKTQVWKFYNIPYAMPPVGARRFKKPEPMKKWLGTWDATVDRGELVECIQFKHVWGGEDHPVGQEDCLYLSVYTPSIPRGKNNSDLRPVIVYIHGGSFMYGSQSHIEPKDLVSRHKVVFVKFNYRLGPFGFLSTDDREASGNMGLKDQILALKWVKENIAAFGGNPDSVTLVGSNAGAASVHFHMLSPRSEGLFHKAISLSGTMLSPWAIAENLYAKTKLLAKHVGCIKIDHHHAGRIDTKLVVECLQTRPAMYLVDAVRRTLPFLYNPVSVWAPTVDSFAPDPVMPFYPGIEMSHIDGTEIPWLVGLTSVEGLYIGSEILRDSSLRDQVDEHWEHLSEIILDYESTLVCSYKNETARTIRNEYMTVSKSKDKCDTKFSCKGFLEMIGDRMFVVDAERSSRWMSKSPSAPVYLFIINADKNNSSTTDKKMQYPTNYLNSITYNNRFPEGTWHETFMNDLWASFAEVGRPHIIHWPEVKPDNLSYMEIYGPGDTDHAPVIDVPELGRRSFWEKIPFLESNRYPHPGDPDLTQESSGALTHSISTMVYDNIPISDDWAPLDLVK